MKDIGKKGVSAAKWGVFSTVSRFGLQLVAQVVLARLLGPDVYGVFGMGQVIFTFATFLATFGFSWSLGQLKDISEEDIRFAFTWQMILGLVSAGALFLAAPWAAQYFREARVLELVQWMSVACIINAAGSVNGNLMRRDMNFRASGFIQIASYAAGYLAIGVPMALLGFGVTALFAAWLVQAAVVTVAGYCIRPHTLRPLLVGPQARAMISIGFTVFFTNIVNWFIGSLDRLLIGRLLNAHAVGVYSAGYNIANIPNNLLITALQPVFMTAGARMQDEPQRLRSAYRQIIATIWILLVPFFAFFALISNDVVHLLYGPAWTDAGPVLAVLFLSMPALVTSGMSTPVLWNTGRARLEILLQLPVVPVAIFLFYAFGSRDVLAAATVAAIVLVLRGAVIALTAFRILHLGIRDCAGWMVRGVLVSAFVTATVYGAITLAPSDWHPLKRLILEAITAMLTFGFLFTNFHRLLIGPDVTTMLTRFVPSLEKWLNRSGHPHRHV